MNHKFIYSIARFKIFLFFIFISSISVFTQEASSDNFKSGRDPFIDLVTPDGRLLNLEPASEEKKITLEGIIYDKNGLSYAIINDDIVTTGDNVGDYSVFRIEENKVILIKDSKPVEYKILEED